MQAVVRKFIYNNEVSWQWRVLFAGSIVNSPCAVLDVMHVSLCPLLHPGKGVSWSTLFPQVNQFINPFLSSSIRFPCSLSPWSARWMLSVSGCHLWSQNDPMTRQKDFCLQQMFARSCLASKCMGGLEGVVLESLPNKLWDLGVVH